MEWFQQSATEQNDRVNGYCKPKSHQDTADVRWTQREGDSGGSDSCGATSVSELTDLQEVKAKESEDEEEEEREVAPASKGAKDERMKTEKQSSDREENKQQCSAASSYTGESFILNSKGNVILRCWPIHEPVYS